MKIGQGSQKRTPWRCWLATTLVAAMIFPGAASVTSAKDRIKRNRAAETTAVASQDPDHAVAGYGKSTVGGVVGRIVRTDPKTRFRLDNRLKELRTRIEASTSITVDESDDEFRVQAKDCRMVVRGEDNPAVLTLKADDGTIRVSKSSKGPFFDLTGNAEIRIADKSVMRADRILYADDNGPQLRGHARVTNTHQGFKLSADNIRCGEETVLEGDACLKRKLPDGTIDQVSAKRIVWIAESGEVCVDAVMAIGCPAQNALTAGALEARESTLAELVGDFNDLMDERRFAEAEIVARQAGEHDPEGTVTKSMLLTVKLGKRIADRENTPQKMPNYLEDDVQYFAPGPKFKSAKDEQSPATHRIVRQAVDRENFEDEEPPTDDEVMRLLERRLNGPDGGAAGLHENQFKNVRIAKERLADYVDPPQVLPLIGRAQMHHAHFKCTVYFKEHIKTGWPVQSVAAEECVETIYVDVARYCRIEEDKPSSGDDEVATSVETHESWEQIAEARCVARASNAAAHDHIRRQLETPVALNHDDTPLNEIAEKLGLAAGVNIFLDTHGLAAEGVTPDTPVTINLARPIRISSALNLILEPLCLKYQVVDEVVKITSATPSCADIYAAAYRVADLVVPVSETVRLEGGEKQQAANVGPQFNFLTELIRTTVAPDSWDTAGGAGAMEVFETNLSLVVSQSQEVHEEIVDLLEQLRRLQGICVSCQMRTFRVPETVFTQRWEQPWTTKSAVLSETESSFVLQMLDGHEEIQSFESPKITLFNGQRLNAPLDYQRTVKSSFAERLHLLPVISNDCRSVRLQMAVASDTQEGDKRWKTYLAGHRQTLLVHITDDLALKQGEKPDRTLLLITPSVQVQEEEEEAVEKQSS